MASRQSGGLHRQVAGRIFYGTAFVIVALTLLVAVVVVVMDGQMRTQHTLPTSIQTIDRSQATINLTPISGPGLPFPAFPVVGGLVCLGIVLAGSLSFRLATGRGLLPVEFVIDSKGLYRVGVTFAVVGHVLLTITVLSIVFVLPGLQDNPNADPDVLAIPLLFSLLAYAASVTWIEASIGIRHLISKPESRS